MENVADVHDALAKEDENRQHRDGDVKVRDAASI